MPDWLCTPNPYVLYTNWEQLDSKMRQILLKYGEMFDDERYYWIPKNRKGQLLVGQIVKCAPLWVKGKGVPAEKYRSFRKGKQTKLMEKVTAT